MSLSILSLFLSTFAYFTQILAHIYHSPFRCSLGVQAAAGETGCDFRPSGASLHAMELMPDSAAKQPTIRRVPQRSYFTPGGQQQL